MNALRQHLAYRLGRAGWQALCGIALLIAAFAYAFVLVHNAGVRSAVVAAEVAKANAAGELALQRGPRQPLTPGEQLQAFYKEFPRGESVPDWLESIYALAAEEKLALELGDYTLTKNPAGRLDRFSITFPVKGSYPQLRRFISAALATAPALALEGLSVKRDKVGEGTVNARIVFQLYLEKGA